MVICATVSAKTYPPLAGTKPTPRWHISTSGSETRRGLNRPVFGLPVVARRSGSQTDSRPGPRAELKEHVSMRLRLFVLVFALACNLSPLSAQQRGQYQPGQFGLTAGVLPSPGFTYVNIAINYASTRLNGPNGNEVPTTGSYNVWALENFFYHGRGADVSGGNA